MLPNELTPYDEYGGHLENEEEEQDLQYQQMVGNSSPDYLQQQNQAEIHLSENQSFEKPKYNVGTLISHFNQVREYHA